MQATGVLKAGTEPKGKMLADRSELIDCVWGVGNGAVGEATGGGYGFNRRACAKGEWSCVFVARRSRRRAVDGVVHDCTRSSAKERNIDGAGVSAWRGAKARPGRGTCLNRVHTTGYSAIGEACGGSDGF